MNGVLFCPSRQRLDVLALVQSSHAELGVDARVYEVVEGGGYSPCVGDEPGKWTDGAIEKLAMWKNEMLEGARYGGFDYAFFTDSDLLLHPSTVEALLATDKDIVSALFLTYAAWGGDGQKKWWPNVRPVRDSGEYPELFRVAWTGACLLLRGRALKLVDPWTPREGFWGEDSWFAESAIRAEIDMFNLNLGDRSPLHIYSPEDIPRAVAQSHEWGIR